MNSKVNPIISFMVVVTIVIVCINVVWDASEARRNYTMPSTTDLQGELAELTLEANAQVAAQLELVDRTSVVTLDQRYVSTSTRDEIARHYREAFLSKGWRTSSQNPRGGDAMWFCKKGVLGAIVFLSGPVPEVFRISMQASAWARNVCS